MEEIEFILIAKNEGYSEPEVHEVEYAPAKGMHRHDHSVLSLVLSGVFTMHYENGTATHGPGDWCENSAGTLHAKHRYRWRGHFVVKKVIQIPHNKNLFSNAAGPSCLS
jgi:quercetin dioxygenase-like cupin family protein